MGKKKMRSGRLNAGHSVGKHAASNQPDNYYHVLRDLTQLIAESRYRSAATVNRELVLLYWQIGTVVVRQQEESQWGDGVVEQLADDLRAEFSDMRGFTKDNLFRMRKFVLAYRGIDRWLESDSTQSDEATGLPTFDQSVGTVSPQLAAMGKSGRLSSQNPDADDKLVGTVSPQFKSTGLAECVAGLSWSHHYTIVARCDSPAERYFYLRSAIAERWSVRELRRQIDSALFARYVSVGEAPQKCLADSSESGDLLPFRDHYVLEFLGLTQQHSERELRRSILANLRDFFLEFGRDFTFVGEEYPLTIGSDTFSIDLLFFHRRLQCLIAIELKNGRFKPEFVGKTQFYCAALDEQTRLPHENPSIGLVLCRGADRVQVRLALTSAAEKIGVATYQTGLPDERLIRQRLKQLPVHSRYESSFAGKQK